MGNVKLDIQELFEKAVKGEPESMVNLINGYLADIDNPDSVERAYRLTKRVASVNDECNELLFNFYVGLYGKKYINFPEYCNYRCYNAQFFIRELQHGWVDEKTSKRILPEAKNDEQWAKWLLACQLYIDRKYEDAFNATFHVAEKELLHCASYLRGYIYEYKLTEPKERLNIAHQEYERAAKHGSVAGMAKVAELCFKRLNDGNNKEDKENIILYYSRMGANAGDETAMVTNSLCYMYGIGTTNDDRQAFKWLYKAIYAGVESGIYYNKTHATLAEFFMKNKLFKPKYGEAYAWIQSYNLKYPGMERKEDRKELTESILKHLSPNYKGMPNKLAEIYRKRLDTFGTLGPYISDDLDPYLDYILDEFTKRDCIFDATVDIQNYLLSKDIVVNVQIKADAVIDESEIEATDTALFSKLNKLPARLEPSDITIYLKVKAERKGTPCDFDTFIFEYKGNHDAKEAIILQGNDFKIRPKERKMLLKLAMLSKDNVQGKQNVKDYLHSLSANDAPCISLFNKLISCVFDNRFKTKRSNMIDKAAGELKIKLIIQNEHLLDGASDIKEMKTV